MAGGDWDAEFRVDVLGQIQMDRADIGGFGDPDERVLFGDRDIGQAGYGRFC